MHTPSTTRDLRLIHSSDLHVDDGRGSAGLAAVLRTARRLEADLVLLAGDTFDSHMVGAATVERARALLAEAGLPVVILPGNHDPATGDSVYRRGGFADIPSLAILGVTHGRAVSFPAWDLEIWGNPHLDYQNMEPLADPPPRRSRWQVALGHGHYEPPETWATPLRPSWLISDGMIAATAADYLALGHWDRAAQVGCGAVPAYYSGAPHHVDTVNLVRLGAAGEAIVRREKVRWP
jgi:DNA repair exonuclease SbcCD nuclease subunit